MKQKLFTILTLLLCLCSTAWADGTALSSLNWSGISAAPTGYIYSTANTPSYQASQGPSKDKRSCMLIGNGGQGQTPTITDDGPTASEGKRWMAFCPAEDCDLTIVCTGNGKTFQLYDKDHYTAKTNVSTSDTHLASYNGTNVWDTWTINGLKAGTWYVLSATSSSSYVYSMTFTASIPSLTGAWKLSTTDVTGQTANIVQGAAAPTMPTFTVGATSGTPTTDNYAVAYSLKEGSTEGIFTFTDGVPTAISTATAGSATVVATLTTKDATKFVAPTTNTFEYTATVAEASAPTAIDITGAASAARGADAITLTAAVTGGNPTPTIEWFKCDDALKTNPVSQGEASTANTTLNVATSTVGTYYFYAVASNSQGSVASDVKTITIVPKAPTLTANGTFTDSKTITIAKASGEAEAATIQYKIGDGDWTAYNDPFNVTATSTVKAKVVQAGLESAEASATYTKVEIGSLITTLEPGGNPGVDVAIPSYSKNGFTLTNGSSFNYSNHHNFPYNFKVGTSNIIVTAPEWATIQAVKVYGFRNDDNNTTTVTANTGATISGSNSLQKRNSDGNLSEVLIMADAPAAANTISFKVGAQSRIMIEVYGSGTNTTTSQAVSATKKYSTFCSVNDLDFTNVDGLEAYVVSSVDETTATIAKVNKVAAGAGLILKKTKNVGEASNFSVPVATSTDNLGSNLMIGVQNDANLSNLKDTDKPKAFILSNGNFSPCSGGTLAAGKAYLFAAAWASTTTTARELTIIEEGAATGINGIEEVAPVTKTRKVVKNGRLVIETANGEYTVSGARVK